MSMTKLTIVASSGFKENLSIPTVYEDVPISQRLLAGLLGVQRNDLITASLMKGVNTIEKDGKNYYGLGICHLY